MRQLIGFLLPQTVPSIRDKNHRNDELAVGVHQLVKSILGCRDGHPSPHQNAVDVEQQSEAWLVLFEQMKNVIKSAPNFKEQLIIYNIISQNKQTN